MKYDLCFGNDELFWEFKTAEDRDLTFKNLQTNPGWKPEWASTRGRFQIDFNLKAIPIHYRWKCSFVEPD